VHALPNPPRMPAKSNSSRTGFPHSDLIDFWHCCLKFAELDKTRAPDTYLLLHHQPSQRGYLQRCP
jgi:hypothetical protein